VGLPERWIRGLAGVPALTRSMTQVGQLRGAAITRFLAMLPRVAPPGPSLHIVPDGSRWRTSGRAVPGAVPLPGTSRLRAADRIARHATTLTVHVSPNKTTAWVFELIGARFTLVISPHPYRGFSGEGTLLTLLTRPEGEQVGRRLLPHLHWSPVIDPAELAARAGVRALPRHAGLHLRLRLVSGVSRRPRPVQAHSRCPHRRRARPPLLVAARDTWAGLTGDWQADGADERESLSRSCETCVIRTD
jgi:hypothetical protein